MIPVIKVRGVGAALAKSLEANGIATAAELAAATPDVLQAVPRIGPARASVLVNAAAEIAVAQPAARAKATQAETTPAPIKSKPPATAKKDKAKEKARKAAEKARELEEKFKKAKKKANAKAKREKERKKAAKAAKAAKKDRKNSKKSKK